jgi:5,10-methylenetetrahydromethanopterin reductase
LWLHGVVAVPELVSLARQAEQRGAAALLLADEGVDRDLYVSLTAIAVATERITLVPAITNPHSRHPVVTAAALGSLAEVAPGRVVVGLGAGGNLVLRPMGIRPPHPFSALAQAVEVIDDLLAGKTVTYDGEFTLADARLDWAPGRLPLAIAGRGPRVERLASQRGDWMLISGKSVTDVAALARHSREQGARVGRHPWIVWNPMVGWEADHLRQIRSHLSYMTVDIPAEWRKRLGVSDAVVADLRDALRTEGPEGAAHLVPDAVTDAFAIVGERHEVVRRLRKAVGLAAPDVVVFGAHLYTTSHVDDIADIAAEVGLAESAGVVLEPVR